MHKLNVVHPYVWKMFEMDEQYAYVTDDNWYDKTHETITRQF
jgi:hypothetical protein